MANNARIVHSKTARATTGSDTGRVYGADWNADHVLTGLENVDNTSDADKNAATATLANKTLASPVVTGTASAGGIASQFNLPGYSVRGAATGVEWGHSNTAGYGSVLSQDYSNGNPYIGFNVQPGTTANTYKTVGVKASIIKSDLAGGLVFGTTASASADNQSLTTSATLSAAGVFNASGYQVNGSALSKSDVGLGNVDNTSDVNKPVSTAQAAADTAVANAASAALTSGLANKVVGPASVTDDLPAIFDGTTGKLVKSKTYSAFKTLLALVKGDVGLGNVDNTSDATKNSATATLTNKTISGANNTLTVREADLSTSDVTTGNVSTTKHGFAPKLPNDATKYLDGTGAYSVPAGGGGGGLSAEETAYWKDKAALLDPAAYVYWKGASWSVTVPAGETWYALNAWVATLNGSSVWWFHRKLASHEAFQLHPGDVISAAGNAASFLYVCRPALVIGNSEYSDPKGLYFSRLSALRAMTTSTLSVAYAAGSTVEGGTLANFPTDFDDGIAAHVSTHNLSWVVMCDALSEGALNTADEVSDTHQWRVTSKLLTPFVRAQFPTIEGKASNISGSLTGTDSLDGHGVLSYYKLPSNWRTTPQRPYKSAVLTDTPVVYYPCDEVSGTTIHDFGSAALNATLGSTSVLGVAGATGDGGGAIKFSDSSGRIAIPNSTNFDFGSGDFTFEIWAMFKTLPSVTSSYTPWIVNGWVTSAIGATNQAFLVAVHNGKIGFLVGHSDGTSTSIDSSVSITTGVFYHIIAGRSGGNLFVRVVGKETRQTTAVSKALRARSTEPVWIGTSNNGSSYQFNMDGRVEEFAMYNSALSDARADAHHAAALGWG